MTTLVANAEKEGNLVIVAGTNDVTFTKKIWDAFGKQFGIKITVVSGSPTDVTSRILAERQQGLYQVDIGLLGGGATQRLLKANTFQPLTPQITLPEAIDRSSGWRINYVPWDSVDTAQKYCQNTLFDPGQNLIKVYYNTDKISQSDLANIHSWTDLLDPKYKGKIVLGDVPAGVDESDRAPSWVFLGQAFFTQLLTTMNVSVEPAGNDRQMADGLARGQWTLAMFPGSDDPFVTAQKQGLPVALMPSSVFKEGAPATLGGRMCMFDKPAHPAAAQLFANWVLSKDGQTVYNQLDTRPDETALRSDVPQGNIPNATWAAANSPDVKVFDESKYPTAGDDSLAYFKTMFQQLKLNP